MLLVWSTGFPTKLLTFFTYSEFVLLGFGISCFLFLFFGANTIHMSCYQRTSVHFVEWMAWQIQFDGCSSSLFEIIWARCPDASLILRVPYTFLKSVLRRLLSSVPLGGKGKFGEQMLSSFSSSNHEQCVFFNHSFETLVCCHSLVVLSVAVNPFLVFPFELYLVFAKKIPLHDDRACHSADKLFWTLLFQWFSVC